MRSAGSGFFTLLTKRQLTGTSGRQHIAWSQASTQCRKTTECMEQVHLMICADYAVGPTLQGILRPKRVHSKNAMVVAAAALNTHSGLH